MLGLAIAGLAHAYPVILAGIARIVFGFALLCPDAGMAPFFSRLWGRSRVLHEQLAAGRGAKAVGGIAGITLGRLTIAGVVPLMVSAVAAIAFGASVIFGGIARSRLSLSAAHRFG